MTADHDIQALVVKVEGTCNRPDGQVFHITLTRRPHVLDRASKAMLRTARHRSEITPLGPWPVPTTPILRGDP